MILGVSGLGIKFGFQGFRDSGIRVEDPQS